ncbi:MAG: ABC transporter ATP-binding protein [Candidatus Caldarchaeales archaeon]|jgi:peptide/nickel transport system ATP-binding protein|nr:ABC transporter ATP-binding protein [Candidatus Caldarchaeales archaeon]
MSKNSEVLRVKGVFAYYDVGGLSVRAVDGVDLSVGRGEVFGLAGESGCGKTTLMRVIYRDITPPLRFLSGEVKLRVRDGEEVDLYKLDQQSLMKMRTKVISYIPQGSMSVMNPTSRIKNQFLEIFQKYGRVNKEEVLRQVKEKLQELGLSERVLNSYPHQLSGGMRQRMVISLATILNPSLVLADEPTSALDVVYQRGVVELIQKIRDMYGTSFILVSHDMGLHYQATDRIAIMYAGKIVETGRTEDVFKKPLHPYSEGLINSIPRIGGLKQLEGLAGLPPNLANPPTGCRFHPRCPYRMEKCSIEEPPVFRVGDRTAACWLLER